MKSFAILITFLVAFGTNAQQDILTSMYWNQYALINPATSGIENKYDGRVTYRNQWPSLSGNAISILGNYNMIVKDHHGTGINFAHEIIGFSKVNRVQLNYNYQFFLKKESRLSIGISPGIQQYTIDGEWVTPSGEVDPLLPEPLSGTSFNMNTGIAFRNRSIHTGIGVTHLNEQRHVSDDGLISFTTVRHYYAHARYTKHLTRRTLVQGEGIFRTDLVKTSFDVNAKIRFINQFWLGVGYRNSSAVTAFTGWDIKDKFHVAYAYDYSISKLSGISGGSHEITIGFQIPHPIPRPKNLNIVDF